MGIFLLKFQLHFSPILLVITGFNTDIIYQGVTYHVQTEDKGLDTPLILSLVYDRGTILASKRSPYEDLVKTGFDEKVLLDRLQKQHKVICAAIKAGRIEDLKRMTLESAAKQKLNDNTKQTINGSSKPIESVNRKIEIAQPIASQIPRKPQELTPEIPKTKPQIIEKKSIESERFNNFQRLQTQIPKSPEVPKVEMPDQIWDTLIQITENEIVFDDIEIVDDEMILAPEAVEIIPDSAKPKEKLSIKLTNDTELKGGDRKNLTILVANGETPISNASVMVKVLGSAFRPLIFHAKTDASGIAIVHLQLPHFKSGRAAVLIKATSIGEEVELRRAISQG